MSRKKSCSLIHSQTLVNVFIYEYMGFLGKEGTRSSEYVHVTAVMLLRNGCDGWMDGGVQENLFDVIL